MSRPSHLLFRAACGALATAALLAGCSSSDGDTPVATAAGAPAAAPAPAIAASTATVAPSDDPVPCANRPILQLKGCNQP